MVLPIEEILGNNTRLDIMFYKRFVIMPEKEGVKHG